MNYIPYVLNILILTPAIVFVLQGRIDVFPQQGDMDLKRTMVVSLWVGVLLVSLLALFDPVGFWPVLVFQVIYNLVFGAIWVLPSLRRRGEQAVPWGAVAIFTVILVAWPYFIAVALVAGGQSGQS